MSLETKGMSRSFRAIRPTNRAPPLGRHRKAAMGTVGVKVGQITGQKADWVKDSGEVTWLFRWIRLMNQLRIVKKLWMVLLFR